MWKINCDLGEGMNNDEKLMPYIDACSIACGGHAGDEDSMLETVKLAIKYDVKVGAHPSFPDRTNFGRKKISIRNQALEASIIQQVKSLKSICATQNTTLHHIKAHGALYNLARHDEEIAQCLLNACSNERSIPFFVPYQSVLASMAKDQGHPIIYEAFGDRAYNDDLSLVQRSNPEACISDPEKVKTQVLQIWRDQTVRTLSGNNVRLIADTFCVHGDNTNALNIVRNLSKELHE